MKKASNLLLSTLYAFLLIIAAIFLFWECYGKEHIEKYIDDNYGQYIIRTSKDCDLIKEFNIPKKNDNGES